MQQAPSLYPAFILHRNPQFFGLTSKLRIRVGMHSQSIFIFVKKTSCVCFVDNQPLAGWGEYANKHPKCCQKHHTKDVALSIDNMPKKIKRFRGFDNYNYIDPNYIIHRKRTKRTQFRLSKVRLHRPQIEFHHLVKIVMSMAKKSGGRLTSCIVSTRQYPHAPCLRNKNTYRVMQSSFGVLVFVHSIKSTSISP